MNERIPDPLDIYLDMDARGEFDTFELVPSRPICEYCGKTCAGEYAYKLEPNIWMCEDCADKRLTKIPF